MPGAGRPVELGLWPSESPADQLQVFAAEVAPALREAVAAHRAGR